MLELARLLGGLSVVLLVIAVAAWVKVLRAPVLQRLDGRLEGESRAGEIASQLLVAATGLSAVAALVAVVGWIAT